VTGNTAEGSYPDFLLSAERARTIAIRRNLRLVLLMPFACIMTGLAGGRSVEATAQLTLVFGLPMTALSLAMRIFAPRAKFVSIGWTIFAQTLLYTAFTALAIIFALIGAFTLRHGASINPIAAIQGHWPPLWIYPLLLFWICMIQITRGISRKLGPGVLFNWLRGRYYQPRVEERIFMFLDMRDSTTLAEELGDLRFSALVRDFFDDLSSPIVESYGEVSHYIGDEAGLTWRPERGLPEARCIQCFYRMRLALDRRTNYYVEHYGRVPGFKAGAHIGTVVATEVGNIKSEIVFHGDVLNTAARTQSMCRELEADLLVTRALAERLPSLWWLKVQDAGEISLKGKAAPVSLRRLCLSEAASSGSSPDR
jgi:class 3 adenylate cyclase